MKYLIIIFALFLSACSTKVYEQTDIKILTIKSPKVKFNDIGYVRNSGKSIELELFIAGKSIDKISINHLICTTKDGCMSKSSFNEEYLSSAYPNDLLQDILLAKPIYNGLNLVKKANGFTQAISDAKVDIIYSVDGKNSTFKDKKNSIIFNIKEPNE